MTVDGNRFMRQPAGPHAQQRHCDGCGFVAFGRDEIEREFLARKRVRRLAFSRFCARCRLQKKAEQIRAAIAEVQRRRDARLARRREVEARRRAAAGEKA